MDIFHHLGVWLQVLIVNGQGKSCLRPDHTSQSERPGHGGINLKSQNLGDRGTQVSVNSKAPWDTQD